MLNFKLVNIFILGAILLPIITIFSYLFIPPDETWSHLIENLLTTYLTNTAFILFWVILFTAIIGVVTAWIITMYNFPGKNIFKWSLVLPISIPTYISAFIYAGLVEDV